MPLVLMFETILNKSLARDSTSEDRRPPSIRDEALPELGVLQCLLHDHEVAITRLLAIVQNISIGLHVIILMRLNQAALPLGDVVENICIVEQLEILLTALGSFECEQLKVDFLVLFVLLLFFGFVLPQISAFQASW